MTAEQLKAIAQVPKIRAETFLPYLNQFMPHYAITGKLREAAFIAQILHESMGFRYTREVASGRAYEGREDLGNIYKGDGVKFKGRGLIQLTGRANYTQLSKQWGVPFDKNPDLLSTPMYAVKSACWFWNSRSLSLIADKPDTWRITIRKGKPTERTVDKFEYITYRINGGFNGLAERLEFYNAGLKVL